MTPPIRVLVVDDEPAFRTGLVRSLRANGLQAESAASGEDALHELGRHDYDVVLLDVKMPGLDGVAVLKTIRRLEFPVSVIMLTGHAQTDDAIALMDAGAFDYLLKPCNTQELLEKIALAGEARLLGLAEPGRPGQD